MRVWAGTSAHLPELPSAASPPRLFPALCGSPAPQGVGSVPAMWFLGEAKGPLSELGWFYTAQEASRAALLQKVGVSQGTPAS